MIAQMIAIVPKKMANFASRLCPCPTADRNEKNPVVVESAADIPKIKMLQFLVSWSVSKGKLKFGTRLSKRFRIRSHQLLNLQIIAI
jgi:hypothetical protein